ncbi:hypothetical protein [Glycomyces harbinensis]|uniref:Uncharacterized protein n=1 Tax=Glycomyces harbinensis TaxID=58114 RepID=A0A1G6ZNE4_9ACTN|nr:hypothetical protein [Glycomyces harbinensis]SDE03365.1 hypothetical protein SAMN05216270_11173 [Glycomyces harbinensis]
MFTKLMKRAMIVCVLMASVVVGIAAPAQAANKTIILSDIDGRQLGYMVFYDSDPQKFKVCDTQRDGYTVTGQALWQSANGHIPHGDTTDGNDKGCNTMVFRVDSDQMRLWWNGPGKISTFANI